MLKVGNGSKVAASAATTGIIRMGTEYLEDGARICVMVGSRVLGHSDTVALDAEIVPAKYLDEVTAFIAEDNLSVCVGEPKARWTGAAFVAPPREGEADNYDASEWYAELFGTSEEAINLAMKLTELAAVGFWSLDKGTEGLRFRPDASRLAAELPFSKRVAAVESKAAETRTSSRRMRY